MSRGLKCSSCFTRLVLQGLVSYSRVQRLNIARNAANGTVRHMSSKDRDSDVVVKPGQNDQNGRNPHDEFRDGVTASNIGRIVSEATQVYHKPTNMDKTILFWAGKYKSKEEIPEMVKLSQMDAARDKMRMLTSLWILIGALLSCLFIIYMGSKRYNKYLDEKYKDNLKMWADMDLLDKQSIEDRKRPVMFKK